jgi:hypothetical protein
VANTNRRALFDASHFCNSDLTWTLLCDERFVALMRSISTRMRGSAESVGLMKTSVVGTCAILVALFAGAEAAQAQATGSAKIDKLVKDALGFVRSPRWVRETGIAKVHTWAKVGRKTCMLDHFHDGSGKAPTPAQAQRAAIRSWADFTAWEYGNAWGRYSIAVSKEMTCSQRSGGWSCTVKARPCRPY